VFGSGSGKEGVVQDLPAPSVFNPVTGGIFSEVQYNPTTFPPPMAPTRHKKRTNKKKVTKRKSKK
jgi:hypothetical protein